MLGTSLTATIAAFAAAGFTVATGEVGAAIAAAAVAGGGVGAASFGYVRAMLLVSKQCSKCSGAVQSVCTSTIYRLKPRLFISS